jgi:undecaprenyl-diphosphatase
MSGTREPVPPSPAFLLRRGIENLRDTLRIVRRRFATRAAVYPRLRLWWLSWAVLVALLAVLCAVYVDPVAGRRQWPAGLTVVAGIFTQLGLGKWYIVPGVAWLLVANQMDWRGLTWTRRLAAYNRTTLCFFILAAVVLSGVAVNVFKVMVGRARPLHFAELGMFSFHPGALSAQFASFPSGHATTVGAVAGVLVLLFPRSKVVVLPLSFWLASTRIFVGAHYPSDTVVGYGLGFAVAVLTALVFARLGFLFRQTDGLPVLRRTVWHGGPRRAGEGRPVKRLSAPAKRDRG